jgi:hypothetical protein
MKADFLLRLCLIILNKGLLSWKGFRTPILEPSGAFAPKHHPLLVKKGYHAHSTFRKLRENVSTIRK